MAKNKLAQGIVLGAIIGGALSLLDRETRRQTIDATKRSSEAISYYANNPKELTDRVKVKVDQLKETAEQLQGDFAFLTDKVNEVKELTPKMKGILNETKETFEHSGEAVKQTFSEEEAAVPAVTETDVEVKKLPSNPQ